MAVTQDWIRLETVTSFSVLTLGSAVLALQSHALNTHDNRLNSHVFTVVKTQPGSGITEPYDGAYTIYYEGYGTSHGSAHAVQAAGIIAMVMGLFGLFGCLYAKTQKPSLLRPHFPTALIFCAFSASVASLVAFAYATAAVAQSDALPIPPSLYEPPDQRNYTILPGRIYPELVGRDIGERIPVATSFSKLNPYYSLEGWTCKARKLAYDAPVLDTVCIESMEARWITLPLFLAALGMLVVSYFGYPARGNVDTDKEAKIQN